MNSNSTAELRKDSVAEAQLPESSPFGALPELAATNGSQPFVPKTEKEKPAIKKHLGGLLAGAGLVLALILVVLGKIPHEARQARTTPLTNASQPGTATQSSGRSSILPITDAGHFADQTTDKNNLEADDVARTAKPRPQPSPVSSLRDIPPFNNQGIWEAPGFQSGGQPMASDPAQDPAAAKSDRDALDKPSLVFVRSTQAASSGSKADITPPGVDIAIGLPPGTRLRARLESAVNTAVSTPVVAVIEYNYEKNGEIVVPSGTKVFGHLVAADSSGFVGVRFDSMILPDGTPVGVEAAATDLQLRPLRGRVEGRHRGKNILVRSVSGVGQIAATLAGRSNLNQPLSESDLLRERISDNIAQASDQEVNHLAVTEHLVVSVSAKTEIYVVLQKPAKAQPSSPDGALFTGQPAAKQNIDQLRQLLQLQKELNQEVNTRNSSQ